MPNVKRYTPKGLNLRDNLLNRDPAFATDVKNVQLDEEGNLVKRDGIETVVATPANAVELVACSFDFDSTLYDADANKLVFIDGAKVPKVLKADGTLVDATQGWIDRSIWYAYDTSTVDRSQNEDFDTSRGILITGSFVNPKPEGVLNFAIVEWIFGDAAYTVIVGDASGIQSFYPTANTDTQSLGSTGLSVKLLSTAKSVYNSAYYIKPLETTSGELPYAEYNDNIYLCDKSNGSPLMKFDSKRYYVSGVPRPVGVQFDAYSNSAAITGEEKSSYEYYLSLDAEGDAVSFPRGATVISSAGTTNTVYIRLLYRVTNNEGDTLVYGDYYQYPTSVSCNTGDTFYIKYGRPVAAQFNELAYKWELLVFQSNNKEYGYVNTLTTTFTNNTGNYIISKVAITMPDLTTGAFEPMENFLDVNSGYFIPPLSKLVAARQNALMVIDVDNNLNWSTQALNSHVENFSALNFEIVGKQTEGSATAIFSQSSKDIIFKRDSLFFIDGSITDNYYMRKSVSNLLGCLNDKSVIPLDGGCLFCTQKGIYFTANGSEPIELSEQIEPLFSDYDFTTARSLLDSMNERVLIYVQTTASHRVIVLDIKHKEWFVFEDIDASLGLVLDNDGDIYFCNSTSIKKLNSNSYDEISTPIASYWKSGWENLGEPSFRKKFLNLKLFSLSNVDWTAKLSTEVDWVEGTKDTEDQELLLDSDNRFALQNLDNNMVYSMRFLIENNNKEAILLTGYEYEYEAPQRKMKG